MNVRFLSFVSTLLLSLLIIGSPALADVNAVTPSTNDANMANGWAYFTADTSVPGQATLTFVSTRGFASCFEYRTDGDTSQSTGVNWNTDITDGLYPFTCVNNSTGEVTVSANEYVEVRMVFGAEEDERFDWTYVGVVSDPSSKDDCKDGGWAAFGFSNQGQCIKFVNTGQDSR